MRYLIFAFLMLFAGQSFALGIPSSVSGFYFAPSIGACYVAYERFSPFAISTKLKCLFFNGRSTYNVKMHNAVGEGVCPEQGAMSLDSPTDSIYISVRYFEGDSLYVVVGTDPVAVSNGVGITDIWQRFPGTQSSQHPYSCAGPGGTYSDKK